MTLNSEIREVDAMDDPADRLFASLPAVFRRKDESRALEHLLRALGTYFLGAAQGDVRGLEISIERIPALFAPLGEIWDSSESGRTPDRFVHWLAAWLSFTPHALFPPDRLRHITAEIVRLYARRGTKYYLEQLLKLCFAGEIEAFEVDDQPRDGFTVGVSHIGIDTRLAVRRPFTFKVSVKPHVHAEGPTPDKIETLHQRVRAVIDFAKPAYTVYELEWQHGLQTRRQRGA
jgi:phage tail-like protein